MAKVIIVNNKDEIIGAKERNDRNDTDIIRVSGLWIFNDQKEILIAQRASNKIYDPGKWGPATAGTVEEGETYVSNIIKEAKEEIGLNINEKDLIRGPHRFITTLHKYFVQNFFLKTDILVSDFVLQKEEVEQLKWISMENLLKSLEEKPEDFLESFRISESPLYDFVDFLKAL
jgi:isopentenyl-diphosphate Delta-isomerase